MNDNKIIHIKKLGIAFYKYNFVRASVSRNGIFIYYTDGKYNYIEFETKRQANLWCTLIVKKLNGEAK